jgi:hypothetical protein
MMGQPVAGGPIARTRNAPFLRETARKNIERHGSSISNRNRNGRATRPSTRCVLAAAPQTKRRRGFDPAPRKRK